jgi:ubiquitin carboxyl-terminal hydrolase 25/28
MHKGMAQAGHYWSYVYDTDKNIWRKFDDTKVSQISEQEVLKKAFGGEVDEFGMFVTNAYCIIYTKEETIKNS